MKNVYTHTAVGWFCYVVINYFILLFQTLITYIPFMSFTIHTGKSLWQLFIEQFDDLLVKILLAAATISFVS